MLQPRRLCGVPLPFALLTQLNKGDYVDLTVDYDILPQQGDMYFGFNAIMKQQLARADSLYTTPTPAPAPRARAPILPLPQTEFLLQG